MPDSRFVLLGARQRYPPHAFGDPVEQTIRIDLPLPARRAASGFKNLKRVPPAS
jgi:hypothetical protein